MPTPEDLVERALSRRLERDRGLPNIEALIRVLVEPFQTIEEVTQTLLDVLPLADATAWVLDTIYGPLLGLRRRGVWDDDTYRYYLDVRVLALRSRGRAAELLELARRFVPENTPLEATRIYPEYPRAFRIEVPDVPDDLLELLVETLELAIGLGVYAQLIVYDSEAAFTMGASPGSTYGVGAGVFGHTVLLTRRTFY